jgi:NMD protein affecting ribosome stability and mRNA decay
MSKCALCLKEADILYTCFKCGRSFDPGCGDMDEEMCADCVSDEW